MNRIDGSIVIEHGSARLQLLADKAIFFDACNTLIVADVHVGKDATFRAAGLPMPVGSIVKDLNRITKLLELTGADRLVILGDFLHARSGQTAETLEAVQLWRSACRELNVLLIRGNHDRSAGRLPSEWNFEEVEEPFDEGCGVLFAHQPRAADGVPVLCGHVHPVVSVRDFDRSSVRVPCFWFDADGCGVLPAFGSLTGGYNVGVRPNERIYLAAAGTVRPLERAQSRLTGAST